MIACRKSKHGTCRFNNVHADYFSSRDEQLSPDPPAIPKKRCETAGHAGGCLRSQFQLS
jgi:hypothetical protein